MPPVWQSFGGFSPPSSLFIADAFDGLRFIFFFHIYFIHLFFNIYLHVYASSFLALRSQLAFKHPLSSSPNVSFSLVTIVLLGL
jgi:hypothetical protein